MKKLMVIPSKANLQKHAQPLDRMRLNKNIRTLVVDRAISSQFGVALRERRIPHIDLIEFTEHPSGLVIALDAQGQFCGAYSLPARGESQVSAVPLGRAVQTERENV